MDIEHAKQTLLARWAELTAHLYAVEDQLDEPLSKDWEDRSAERQGDEVLEALGAQELAEVRQIDAGLARAPMASVSNAVARLLPHGLRCFLPRRFVQSVRRSDGTGARLRISHKHGIFWGDGYGLQTDSDCFALGGFCADCLAIYRP